MNITTNSIVTRINSDFASAYRNAAPFVNSGPLWDFCIEVLSDYILTKCIIFSNDLGVPPVKSLLHLYRLKFGPAGNFQFSAQESQWLGSLMGFVFKNIFNYKAQKERNQVNELGIKTATRFLEGPVNIAIE